MEKQRPADVSSEPFLRSQDHPYEHQTLAQSAFPGKGLMGVLINRLKLGTPCGNTPSFA